MARYGKQSPEDQAVGCLSMVFIIPIVGLFFQSWRVYSTLALGALILIGVFSYLQTKTTREKHLGAATAKAVRLVDLHMEELARRYISLVRVDHYGVMLDAPWRNEWDHFFGNVIAPELSTYETAHLNAYKARTGSAFDDALFDSIKRRAAEIQNTLTLHDELTPVEFEIWCKDALLQSGWSAYTTKGSGDQGADVVAEKHGVRVVIQCKLYSKAVGNKAVQEAFAAQRHYGTHRAAVVSNSGYTTGARQIASTTGVLLLHLSDLMRLDEVLREASRRK